MTISKADLDTAIITSEAYGEQSFPFEEWRWLRANDPIHWTDVDKLENFWAITRHRHITEISSQPEVFSNEAGNIVIFREEQAATFDREANPFN